MIPSELIAYFDMRITPEDSFEDLETLVSGWAEHAGPDVRIEFLQVHLIPAHHIYQSHYVTSTVQYYLDLKLYHAF